MKKLILNILTTMTITTGIALSMQYEDAHMFQNIQVHSGDGMMKFETYENGKKLEVFKPKFTNNSFPNNYRMPQNILLNIIQDIAKKVANPENIYVLYLPKEINYLAIEGGYLAEYLCTIHAKFPELRTFNIGEFSSTEQDSFIRFVKANNLNFSIDRLPPKLTKKR
jgi:hypothetical protein